MEGAVVVTRMVSSRRPMGKAVLAAAWLAALDPVGPDPQIAAFQEWSEESVAVAPALVLLAVTNHQTALLFSRAGSHARPKENNYIPQRLFCEDRYKLQGGKQDEVSRGP